MADVRLLASAREDLKEATAWLAEVADPDVARDYAVRLRRRCRDLSDFANRGSSRGDLEPGLRSIPFERSATIFYRVAGGTVEIVRIIRKGRDLGRLFTKR